MSNETSTNRPWSSFYIEEPPINPDIEIFFSKYAGIPPSELRDHLCTVRQRAWQQFNYPCLGRWGFLQFSIQHNPIYKEILDQCANGTSTMIDFGCCLGQDVRRLIYDGVPIDRIRGYELDPFFIEQGYDLFKDGELMRKHQVFTSADIFNDEQLATIEPADYLHAASFIHLFDAQTQREVCRRLSRLAKRAIIGRQVGSRIPEERERGRGTPGSKMMFHSPESFASMWNEVTNGDWQVESVKLETREDRDGNHQLLIFVVRKKDEK